MSVRRRVALVLAAAATGGLVLAGTPGGASAAQPVGASAGGYAGASARPAAPTPCPVPVGGASPGRLVIRAAAGADVTAVAEAVRATGSAVVGVQAALGTLVARVRPDALAAVCALPGVAVVTADYQVKAQSLGFNPWTQGGSMTEVTTVTGANGMWRKGYTGNGIDVALIDTGVAPVPGLQDSAKVVVGPDLSFESQDPGLRYLDTYGHGTHMAGIIAGRERAKGHWWDYAWDSTNFYGMAPDARIVSLKLADHNGVVDVSQMIAAVDWVVQNRQSAGLNIRVLNLSYGTHSPQSPQADPLSWAAEVAWKSGIVVVASAGNDGATVPGLTNPAYNPWVIAVGAADTHGTVSLSDDTVPSFSARQGGNFINRGIDLVAPGVSIVSLGVPGSYVYDTYPAARIGNGFIRGSGTSQAAAVVSGGAALLLSQRSFLTPDQVKALLVNGATKLAGQPTIAQGNGELNLATSMALPVPSTVQSQPNGNGTGGLESARGGVHVVMDGWQLADERDIMGNSFVGPTMAAQAGSGAAWSSNGSFNGSVWLGAGFSADTTGWAGKTWGGKTWTGKTWSGKTWSNAVWTGSGWSSATWSAPVASSTWAGAAWSTEYWN